MDADIVTRQCSKCGAIKPTSEFYVRNNRASGYNSRCKNCICEAGKIRSQAWRDRLGKETVAARQRERRKADSRHLEYMRAYREAHREKIRESDRAWRHSDASAEYRARNRGIARERERRRLQQAEYRAQKRAKNAEFARAHPLHFAQWQAKCRALKHGLQVEEVDYAAVLLRDAGHCHICGKSVHADDLEFDHVIPMKRGGAHVEENVKVAHSRCNRRKANKLISELEAEANGPLGIED